MIITTTPGVEGQAITEYKGLVSGEAIVGVNVVKDIFAGLRDIVGGRSGSYEQELRKAQQIALQELEAKAVEMGADAVVGIDLDYEAIGSGGSMLMVSACGTAVKLAGKI